MTCITEPYKKKYDYLVYIDVYIKNHELAEKNGDNNIYEIDYNFINNFNDTKFHELRKMCNIFIYLVDALFKRNGGDTFNDDYDFDYLNYWLNAQIHEIDPENICKKIFFQHLMSKVNGNQYLRKLRSSIYDIEENVLNNMNSIYTLYKFYNEIKKIINGEVPNKENIINIANNCVLEYKKIKDACPPNDTHFCKALKNFKEKYEEINLCNLQLAEWKKKKLPLLTGEDDTMVEGCTSSEKAAEEELEQAQGVHVGGSEDIPDMNVKNITIGTTATIGISFICFIFYKFNLFGHWVRSRISKNENSLENYTEQKNQFTLASEYDHIYWENAAYNIAYNSV
ncbi:PIR Superfamily Protein [Plasmodium ovale wallikeri]|uniref:PIR Superfamily Protein n=2 Tax=Plasmodium ovale TaxID=36330 RepID=A0A1A9ASL4_PLAOA|nr:PIR Superfamily Protein [Plasmodium ovale wallikeri]SBT59256.1 PIR Superfamily Protein [Plasmodium ovale wallikeri]SBT73080.1 PIR protein [Plasmodium ovale]